MEEDFGNGLSLLLSEAGSAISVLGLLLSAVSTLAGKLQILKYAMFVTGLAAVICIIVFVFIERFGRVRKWRNPILVAVDELLKK